jgi:hypothetical protein
MFINKLKRWFYTIKVGFRTPLFITKQPVRFMSVEDALLYFNKDVEVCLVESPNVVGRISAINNDGYVKVKGCWYGYWNCKPLN